MNRLVFGFFSKVPFGRILSFWGVMYVAWKCVYRCGWSETEEAWFAVDACLLRCDQQVEATYFGRVSLLLLVTILRMFYLRVTSAGRSL
jgi:hypothetical protein